VPGLPNENYVFQRNLLSFDETRGKFIQCIETNNMEPSRRIAGTMFSSSQINIFESLNIHTLYDGNAESRHFFWGRPQMVIQQTLGWIMFGGLLTLGHYPW
jgi:hypothetical protein